MRGKASDACRPRALGAALTAVVLLMAAQADGQQGHADLSELSLEDLMSVEIDTVYGVSRYQQKIQEAPASVTIVSREEIAAYGYRTLADALRSVGGLYVTADRSHNYIGLSGLARSGSEGGQVLVLLDGHRMNDNVTGLAVVGREFPIDMGLVERIEIIRGPTASVYGASAFLGVVNVVTRRGAGVGLTVSTGAGNRGNLGAATAYGTRTGSGLELLLSASSRQGAEEGALQYGAAGGERLPLDATDDRISRLHGSASFAGFRIRGIYAERNAQAPEADTAGASGFPETVTFASRALVDLEYERSSRAGVVLGRVYYDRYRANGISMTPGSFGATAPDRLRTAGNWWGTEVRLTTPAGRAHRVMVGAEYVQHERREHAVTGPDPAFSADENNSRDWSLDAQDQWQIVPRLSVNLSVRFDHDSRFDASLSPRVAVVYGAASGTTVKTILGRLRRMPSTSEEYAGGSDAPGAHPDLRPEHLNAGQFLIEHRVGSYLRTTAGVFLGRSGNRIGRTLDQDGVTTYENVGRATLKGVDLSLEARARANAAPFMRASYSGQWTNTSTASPHHLLSMTGLAPIPGIGARLGAELQYVSERQGFGQSSIFPGYTLAHLNLTRNDLLPGLDCSVGIRNVFGTRYAVAIRSQAEDLAMYREGRTFGVRLTYHRR